MGDGYKTRQTGMSAIADRFKSLERQIAALRSAAVLRNSAITGGQGLIVGGPGRPQVQLAVDPNPLIGGTVSFNDADDPNLAGGIRGSLNQLSLYAPFEKGTPAVDVAEVNLITGPGVPPKIVLSAGNAGVTLWDDDALSPGSPAQVDLLGFSCFDSGGSTRLAASSASLVFPSSTAECRVRAWDDSAYVPIRASAFTVSSSRHVKHAVQDLGWSPLDVVRAAQAHQWRYLPTEGDPDRLHVGPMAEDLPDELVDHTGPTPAVDLAVLVGVLWAAVSELAAEVKALRTGAADPQPGRGMDFPPGPVFDSAEEHQ